MKTLFLQILATLFLALPNVTFGQVVGFSAPGGSNYEMVFIPGPKLEDSGEFERIAPKMYLTPNYLAAKVDNIVETIFLKYNIYKDEMEFSKNGQVLFLKKQNGRIITFDSLNQKYKIFKFEDKLAHFMVHNDGKNQLLSRQIVKFQKEKLAKTSYQVDKPADFKRQKDVFYLKFDNVIKEISSSKRKFYDVFGDQAKSVKKFVKTENLNIKNIEGLEKIMQHLNTI